MILLKRLGSALLCAGTFVASWYVYTHWMFPKLYPKADPWLLGTVLILSILFHEVSHWLVFEWNGIRANMIFLVILGGAMPWTADNKKVKGLRWVTLAKLYLAGVMGNLVFVACCAVAWCLGYLTTSQLSHIANLNGELVLYNLLPLFILDGGRFAKVLFDSTPESEDDQLMMRLVITVGILACVASFLSAHSFLFTIWLFAWGMHFQANHDDPHGSYDRKAMTRSERGRWVTIYIALIFAGIILLATTSPWTK